VVAERGSRDFLAQTSVLPVGFRRAIQRVPGVGLVTPINQQFAMLTLHDRRVLSLLIGYDSGAPGGPWTMASGRTPRASGEVVLDRVLASGHGLKIGSTIEYRATRLRVVGLSSGTSGFMTPLAFATRHTVASLSHQAGMANFFFVRPAAGVTPMALARRISRDVPGVSALTRADVAANDRALFSNVFSGILLPMVVIAFAVAIIVIGLAVYSSTAERSREYATLKALGLSRWSLVALVARQALVLAAAGTALGVGLGFAAASAIGSLAPKYLIAISAGSVITIAVSALVIAVIGSLVPARFVARLDPATAFRR
jgi:putative ABC transport system permease protein